MHAVPSKKRIPLQVCCTKRVPHCCHTTAIQRVVPNESCLSSHTQMRTSASPYKTIIIRRITWLPKACRNAAVRQQVAEAVIKAICGVTASETTPDKVVVRARRRT